MKFYSNEIYPIGLVLSHDAESVNEHYMVSDGSDVPSTSLEEANTYTLTRRTDKYHAMAVGIVFNSPITDRLSTHEGFHAACFIMNRLGIPLSDYSEEAWAYLIGWIGECIDKFCNDTDGIEEI